MRGSPSAARCSTRILLGIDPKAGRLTLANPSNRDDGGWNGLIIKADTPDFAYLSGPPTPAIRGRWRPETCPALVLVGGQPLAPHSHVAIAAFIVNMLVLAAPLSP